MIFNLLEAKRLIIAAKTKHHFNSSQESILENLLIEIDCIEAQVHKEFGKNINTSEKVDLILKQFKQNSLSANEICFKTALDLKKLILTELVNTNIANEFQTLLKNILPHIDGVIENAANNIRDIKQNSKPSYIYRACYGLGGFCMPMTQSLDPLLGMEMVGEKWSNNSGECAGLIEQGYNDIKITGIPDYYPVVCGKANEIQSSESSFKNFLKIITAIELQLNAQKTGDINTFISNTIEKISDETVYSIDLSGSFSHATRLRKIPNTLIYEYYDPNFGTFFFNSKESFVDFFVILINYYRLQNNHVTTLRCSEIGKQNVSSLIEAPVNFSHKAKKSENDLMFIMKSTLDIAKKKVINKKDSLNYARCYCLEILSAALNLIDNPKSLLGIKNHILTDYNELFFNGEAPCDEIITILKIINKKTWLAFPAQDNKAYSFEIKNYHSKYNDETLKISEPINKINSFKNEKFESFSGRICVDKLEKFINILESFISSISTSELAMLTTLTTYLKDGLKLFTKKYNSDLAMEYFDEFISMNEKFQKSICPNQSSSAINNMLCLLKYFVVETHNLKLEIDPSLISTRFFASDNEKRLEEDKFYISFLILSLKNSKQESKSIPNFLKKIGHANGKSLSQELFEVLKTTYVAYKDLEIDIHNLNKKYHGELDDFFKFHLGYSQYSHKMDIDQYYVGPSAHCVHLIS